MCREVSLPNLGGHSCKQAFGESGRFAHGTRAFNEKRARIWQPRNISLQNKGCANATCEHREQEEQDHMTVAMMLSFLLAQP
eukprot:5537117-Amphidinium_carterae.1